MAQSTNNWGIVAEFDSAAAIYEAAKKTTDEGYRIDPACTVKMEME